MGKEQILKRLAEIQAALGAMDSGDNGFSEDQITEIETLNNEFEGLDKQLTALEQKETIEAKLQNSNRKVAASVNTTNNSSPTVEMGKPRHGGFKNNGEFLMAVKRASNGDIDKRFQNTAYEKNGEDGGFLIPDELAAGILKKLEGDDSLISRARDFQISGNSLSVNVDESQPWNGGVQAYWVEEGGAYTESKPNFKRVDFRLHKLGALVKATDELLDDAAALESYIGMAAPEAVMHKVNQAMLNGNGVGKPSGILDSPFTVQVAKESAQTADTIVAENVVKMYSHMIPQARANAVWLAHPSAEEGLNGLKDSTGNFIYLSPGQGLNQSPNGVLLGRPVMPMMAGLPGIGDAGDIVLADFNYYWAALKAGGVKSASSIHLYFDRDITAFKFTLRLDGKVPFTSPVTTEQGGYNMSAFIKLAERA
jgi:HK97 family phage major capsid protein